MPTYAIGDVQGCFSELKALLAKIRFNAYRDTLWFTGDLINRGPQSLATLRFVRSLGDHHQIVLGNHDLHLLAIAIGNAKVRDTDTLTEILNAPDCDDLIDWLRHRPLLVHDTKTNYTLVHAGIAPQWTIPEALSLAKEVEKALQGEKAGDFLEQMYGNHPDQWDNNLQGVERLRCIVNYLTRMRFCYSDGRLDLNYKGTLRDKPPELIPWFQVTDRKNKNANIVFGHWAALGGVSDVPGVFPLDTGCVWGNYLTAMRIDTEERVTVSHS